MSTIPVFYDSTYLVTSIGKSGDAPSGETKVDVSYANIPLHATPEHCYYDVDTASVLVGLPGLAGLKEAARAWLSSMLGMYDSVMEQGAAHLFTWTNSGLSIVTLAIWGGYQVGNLPTPVAAVEEVTDDDGNVTTEAVAAVEGYTVAERLAFYQNSAKWPTDCTDTSDGPDIVKFMQVVEGLTSAQTPAQSPLIWVTPSDGARIALTSAVSTSSTEFAKSMYTSTTFIGGGIDLLSGEWITSLPA